MWWEGILCGTCSSWTYAKSPSTIRFASPKSGSSFSALLGNDIVARKEVGRSTPKGIIVGNGGVCGRLTHNTRLDVGEIFFADGSVTHADQEPCVLWIVLLPVVFREKDDTGKVLPQQ